MFSKDSAVLYEVKDKIGVITINRPERRNAISIEVYEKLDHIWNTVDEDDNVRVVILTAVGDKAFSAGMDLKEQTELSSQGKDMLQMVKDPMMQKMNEVKKPIIAAVNGVAAAGGFLLAQNADLRIASFNAEFSIREAKVGRGSPWAVPLLWMLPLNISMELSMTAEPLSAERLYQLGYVNKLVEHDQLVPAAMEMAQSIRDNAPLSVMAAKQSLKDALDLGKSLGLKNANRLFEKVYSSQDAIEGPKAFAENRKPNWQGR
ncbi:enoyl-CoA hydratase/isomerase family protein [Neobacillus sp. MM2021_6]|uniref:enoyl-CoA hydratase/isomerase family protein n=1 Tax=Bacillaceae TaxID=186817 RepID=UPI00140AAD41|nr:MULTISPECIES: enoyl-CoA hydratase-related protein [Bacillaceae]MBO0959987.1 enoyl-CoA hydratase/isomerase family protein [Neobacillus sp. MM2021_6]NHC18691.1 enoyl-CoA hydratase/isomerase family protein [Bacillus sp. MM2020_4]